MTTYIVTLKEGGAEVHRYEAEAAIEWHGMEFTTHLHTPVQAEHPQPAPRPVQRWDEFDFLQRFDPTERLAIRDAAKANVALQDFIELLRAAGVARNDDPDVHRALAYLTQLGILAAGRTEEILYG